jgi:hypothetical protein
MSWAAKKIGDQAKLSASWAKNRNSAPVRRLDRGAARIRASARPSRM